MEIVPRIAEPASGRRHVELVLQRDPARLTPQVSTVTEISPVMVMQISPPRWVN